MKICTLLFLEKKYSSCIIHQICRICMRKWFRLLNGANRILHGILTLFCKTISHWNGLGFLLIRITLILTNSPFSNMQCHSPLRLKQVMYYIYRRCGFIKSNNLVLRTHQISASPSTSGMICSLTSSTVTIT